MESPRTPAQLYAATAGAFLLLLGALALTIAGVTFGGVSGDDADDFVLWEVSGWTTITWIAFGALGLLAMPRVEAARTYALTAGAFFLIVAIWGFIDGESVFGIIVAGTTNNITHAALAAGGLLAGFVPSPQQRRMRVGENERRAPDDGSRSVPGSVA